MPITWDIPVFQNEEYDYCNLDDETEIGVTRLIIAYKELASKRGATPKSLSRLTFKENSAGKSIRDTSYYEGLCEVIDFILDLEKDPQHYVSYHFQNWDRNHKARILRGLAHEQGNYQLEHNAGISFPPMKMIANPELMNGFVLFRVGNFVPRRHLTLDQRFKMYNDGWNKQIENWSSFTGKPEEAFWGQPSNFYYDFLERPESMFLTEHLQEESSLKVFLDFFDCVTLHEVYDGFKDLQEAEEEALKERKAVGDPGEMFVNSDELLLSEIKKKEIKHRNEHADKHWDINSVEYILRMLADVYPEVSPPTKREYASTLDYAWAGIADEEEFETKWEKWFGEHINTWNLLTGSVVNPYAVLSGKVDPEHKLKLYKRNGGW